MLFVQSTMLATYLARPNGTDESMINTASHCRCCARSISPCVPNWHEHPPRAHYNRTNCWRNTPEATIWCFLSHCTPSVLYPSCSCETGRYRRSQYLLNNLYPTSTAEEHWFGERQQRTQRRGIPFETITTQWCHNCNKCSQ